MPKAAKFNTENVFKNEKKLKTCEIFDIFRLWVIDSCLSNLINKEYKKSIYFFRKKKVRFIQKLITPILHHTY